MSSPALSDLADLGVPQMAAAVHFDKLRKVP